MHIIGNSTSCWSLSAYASRTLVALGYHHTDALRSISDGEEYREIRVAVAWCYHFDRLMSLLLLRSPSLPPLDVEVASLVEHDRSNPASVFARVMLEMVPIHEKILEMTLESSSKRAAVSPSSVAADVEDLRSRMAKVYTTMEQVSDHGSNLMVGVQDASKHKTQGRPGRGIVYQATFG
jgi:hypothetical protein